jgi:hypothetical protein
MRMMIGVVGLGFFASAGMLHAQTAGAGKLNTQWNCAAPDPVHALPVGDTADHVYVVQQTKCTATKGEIAGVTEKEGASTEFAEGMRNNAKGQGVFVATFANGDKITYAYTFTGVSSGNDFQSGSNTWTMTGGTGTFKGIKGSGTCSGKPGSGGSSVFDCVGTYTVAK